MYVNNFTLEIKIIDFYYSYNCELYIKMIKSESLLLLSTSSQRELHQYALTHYKNQPVSKKLIQVHTKIKYHRN